MRRRDIIYKKKKKNDILSNAGCRTEKNQLAEPTHPTLVINSNYKISKLQAQNKGETHPCKHQRSFSNHEFSANLFLFQSAHWRKFFSYLH